MTTAIPFDSHAGETTRIGSLSGADSALSAHAAHVAATAIKPVDEAVRVLCEVLQAYPTTYERELLSAALTRAIESHRTD